MRTRRDWLLFAVAAACGASSRAAALSSEARDLRGFDAIEWDGVGELFIEQGAREGLVLEAETAVLAKLEASVQQRRLSLRLAPGRIVTQQPIRWRVSLQRLSLLESRGSGMVRAGALSTEALVVRSSGGDDIRLAALRARSLDARLDGSGNLSIDGGRVERQRVIIGGAGNYSAPSLASREAEVAIDGGGEMRLAVSDRLVARIAGAGDVMYLGDPRVEQSVTGAGEVRRLR